MGKRKMVKHKTDNIWSCTTTYGYNDLKDVKKEKQERLKKLNSYQRALKRIIALERKLADARCAYNQSVIDDMNETMSKIRNKIKKTDEVKKKYV